MLKKPNKKGSGKSTVSAIFAKEFGISVVDADFAARKGSKRKRDNFLTKIYQMFFEFLSCGAPHKRLA